MKIFITAVVLLLASFSLVNIDKVEAAKKFVPKTAGTGGGRVSGGSIPVSVRYRADKRAIHFSFSNFSNFTSVSYVFSYQTNGISQGAAGTITASNSPGESRELLFGTCSTSVCTYHSGIKDARLTFSGTLKNGKKVSKNFRIKTYI